MSSILININKEKRMTELLAKIETSMHSFLRDSAKVDNKSAARRARLASNSLTKMLKEYRKLSIK